MFQVELVYMPITQALVHMRLNVHGGATVMDVLQQSGLFERYPETTDSVIGIFSKRVEWTTLVCAGDRLEVYRSLQLDPKDKRRQRARKIK